MLSGNTKRNSKQPLLWNDAANKAFEKSRTLLSESTLLQYPQRHTETCIAVDASAIGLGAVLQQRCNGDWRPISFYSRKLNKTEQKYSTFSRELLAIKQAIKFFLPYVEGTHFHVLSDHKPFQNIFERKTARDFPREERWLEYISLHTTDIRHVSGKDNTVADALSTPPRRQRRRKNTYDQSNLPSIAPILENSEQQEIREAQNSRRRVERYLGRQIPVHTAHTTKRVILSTIEWYTTCLRTSYSAQNYISSIPLFRTPRNPSMSSIFNT